RRPPVEDHWVPGGMPADAQGRQRTAGRADVAADREIEIVFTVDVRRVAPRGPEVSVARILLDENPRPHPLDQWVTRAPVVGRQGDDRVGLSSDPGHPGGTRTVQRGEGPFHQQGALLRVPPGRYYLAQVAHQALPGRSRIFLEELEEEDAVTQALKTV